MVQFSFIIEQGREEPPDTACTCRALAEAVILMADHPERARQMGANARAYLLAHFDRPKVAAEPDELLRQIVK